MEPARIFVRHHHKKAPVAMLPAIAIGGAAVATGAVIYKYSDEIGAWYVEWSEEDTTSALRWIHRQNRAEHQGNPPTDASWLSDPQ